VDGDGERSDDGADPAGGPTGNARTAVDIADSRQAMNEMVHWRARSANASESDALFADTLSFAGEVRRNEKLIRRAAWCAGGLGLFVGVAGMVCAASLFPLKRTEVRFVTVDSSTGFVGESIAATDAPATFNERVAHQYLRLYIEAREAYVPEIDPVMFERTQILSAPDERARYAAWHKDALSPLAALGKNGHIEVANFHPLLEGAGKAKTLVYHVRYDRRETRGQTIGPWKHWTATVYFQWHPELIMNDQQRQVNPAGMQVIQYQSNEDPG
jgi:type IV secretion system protein VirB8